MNLPPREPVRETTTQESVREAVDGGDGVLADAAAAGDLPPWLLPWLVELERRQVRRYGRAGITTQVASALEHAALGRVPAGAGGVDTSADAARSPRVFLRELRLVNFRQFAEARIDFTEQPSRPVTLVEAQNGFGKSHLVEALRFALVDYLARPGPGARGSFDTLLHRYAQGEKPHLEVHVALEIDGDAVLVWRRLSFRRSGSGFAAEGRPTMSVRIPGRTNPLQDSEATDWLSHRLPPAVVGYFVFDAESQVVQELSGQAGERLPEVKGQVEAAIGARSVRDAARRVREREAAIRADLGELRRERTPEQLAARLAEIGSARAATEVKVAEAQARAGEARLRIDEIERLLGSRPGPPSGDGPIAAPGDDARLADLHAEIERLRGIDLAGVVDDLPLALLQPILGETRPRRAAVEDTPALRRALDVVADAVARGAFPWARPGPVEGIRADLVAAVGLPPSPSEALLELARRSRLARQRLEGSGLGRLPAALAEARELEARTRDRPPPSPDGPEEGRALWAERDRRRGEELAALQEDELGRGRLAELDAEAQELERLRGPSQETARRRSSLERQAQLARAAGVALDAAADAMRQGSLRALQRAASAALHRTTNKPDLFHAIEFDPDTLRYRVVDPDGHPVPPDRSTGERTVLALALVTGLQRASGLEFPLVMEAPLKPLDPVHQTKVVTELLASRGHQTILLVKPGEIPEYLLGVVSARVGRRFTLRRPIGQRDLTEVVADGGTP